MSSVLLSPEKAVAYCAIVLSDIALNPFRNNTRIEYCSFHLDLAGISMPHVDVKGALNEDQLSAIREMIDKNLSSSKYRFAKILHHYRGKVSKCLNSRKLESIQYEWLHNSANIDVDIKLSPKVIVEERLHNWTKRASDKSAPGMVGKSYTEYLESVFTRLV